MGEEREKNKEVVRRARVEHEKKPLRAPDEEHLEEPLAHTEWKVGNIEWKLKTVEACDDLMEEEDERRFRPPLDDIDDDDDNQSECTVAIDEELEDAGLLAEVAVRNQTRPE